MDDSNGMNWAAFDWLEPNIYGSSKNQVSMKIGNVTLYFSFKTIVGFSLYHGEVTLTPNEWGQHTGKHMNNIRALKEISVECESREEFELLLKHALFSAAMQLDTKLRVLPIDRSSPRQVEI